MTSSAAPALQWHPLESLAPRFQANVVALESRDPALARRLRELKVPVPFFIAAVGDNVYLGRPGPAGIEVIVDPMPPVAARALAARIFPAGLCTGPLMVSGLGYGWLWDRLAKLPCKVDTAPGHRPPIYFLAADLEQLWAVLHVMDWRDMLAQPRLAIVAGPDAFEQLRQRLTVDALWPVPRGLVRIDSTLPPQALDAFNDAVQAARDEQLGELYRQIEAAYGPARDRDWADRFRGGPLRVLGITSRYTTFLQHSMRDWLAAFDRLGHETRLAIEEQDHLMLGPQGYARAIAGFDPDLILIIDHYRAEIGAISKGVPCVMWTQDWLPNYFNDAAGAAQGPRDYCLGYGRTCLTQVHGYPAERFMACPIGINEERFKPAELTEQDRRRYGCDLSYISHASTPADVLLKNALAQTSDEQIARLLCDLHDRLLAESELGNVIHAEWQIKIQLERSTTELGIELQDSQVRQILWLFNTQINNAIVRHQALRWAADLGVHLKLYGNGWDKHPTLSRFACGPADTQRDVPRICAASKINLQVTPHGAVHQRLLEGLIADGFYLLRWLPGDELGIAFRLLRDWCLNRGIDSESALRSVADSQVRGWIAECDELRVDHTGPGEFRLIDRLIAGGDAELATRAGAVWPDVYPQVAFRSAAELKARLTRFLGDEDERKQIASLMRARIIEQYTYQSISRRLLRFIADDLNASRSTLLNAA